MNVKIGFYSCMGGVPWGGSEVLWWNAAKLLQERNCKVTVNYKYWRNPPTQLLELEDKGASIWYRDQTIPPVWPLRVASRFMGLNGAFYKSTGNRIDKWLDKEKPDCVLVTVGYHPDRIAPAEACIKRKIPYAINVQCASYSTFIQENHIDDFRRMYTNAEKVFFVSNENREKGETNLAMKLDNAEIVDNPFSVPHDANPDWPDYGNQMHLACVGRIHFQSKGQDILVRVLEQEKWRKRAIRIWIYGKSQGNRRQLKEMVRQNDLQSRIKFGGFADDIEDLWSNYHGLILPSRYEGAALVVVEAMMCNRICITTDIGRNKELIDDGETGFLAPAATMELMDDALERAWRRRNEWREMGLDAGKRIRERYGIDPIEDYANRLQNLVASSESSTAQTSNVEGSPELANMPT